MIEFVNKIFEGNASSRLSILPDGSVNCCVTSPPYYGLRDYGNDEQIGTEESPEKYIERLVRVFSQVKRVLTDDGTLWVNIGDSYASSAKNRTENHAIHKSRLMGSKASQIACKRQINKLGGGGKTKGFNWNTVDVSLCIAGRWMVFAARYYLE